MQVKAFIQLDFQVLMLINSKTQEKENLKLYKFLCVILKTIDIHFLKNVNRITCFIFQT